MTQVIFAERALLPGGWAEAVRIVLEGGRIRDVTPGAAPEGARHGLVLPAMPNLHSHAFQRAMAGLTERRGPEGDSFWTWRALMYRFLDHLTPEDVQAITAFVQMEMLEAGYGASAEFHYLHHQPGGAPYARLAEMSERVAAAAAQSGIGLTLLPVLYSQGGLDGRALGPGQVRFGNDFARFSRLLDGAREAVAALPPDSSTGVAPHSLRAVRAEDLRAVAALGGPVHLHLAEQQAEVAEVEAHTGRRPVEWVLENLDISGWCMIHATQMTPDETVRLAGSGAIAGLCPITESSLGDGIFDGVRWLGAGGAFGIGSDSNIRVALSEELRTLDYSQRLRDRSRAALAEPGGSTGRRLYEGALAGGARALGRACGAIAPGLWADLLVLDAEHETLVGKQGDALLDSWIFAGDDRLVREVWSAGRHVVTGGRHVMREEIVSDYKAVMRRLGGLL